LVLPYGQKGQRNVLPLLPPAELLQVLAHRQYLLPYNVALILKLVALAVRVIFLQAWV